MFRRRPGYRSVAPGRTLTRIAGWCKRRMRDGKPWGSRIGSSFLDRYQRSWRLSRWSRTSILCLCLVVLFGTLGIAGYRMLRNSDIFLLTELNVYGNVMTSRQQVMDLGGLSLGMSILGIDPDEAAARIREHPWIQRVDIERILPSTIEITVQEYVPWALVNLEDNGIRQLYYLSRNGTIFAPVEPGQNLDLPVLTGMGLRDILRQEGSTTPALREAAMDFLRLAGRGNAVFPRQIISEIHLQPDKGLTVYLVDYPFPILVGQTNIRQKYNRLVKLLGWYYRKDGLDRIEKIDMDYAENQVLVTGLVNR